MEAHLYIVGRVCLETPVGLFSERDLPGRQGRLLLVALAVDPAHAVTRETLAQRLWAGHPPTAWEGALSALVSKLRALLARAVPCGSATVARSLGCHQLLLPVEARVDREVAVTSLDAAEGALSRGDLARAWSCATTASAILHRPFLLGDYGDWAEQERGRLRALHVRALSCLGEVWSVRGNFAQAGYMAREAIALEPYRETGYRQLMSALHAGGDRAEALRVYGQCRALLADELGTDPSAETELLYRRILA
jgi:DNA-binding SARP family transcriptional activator